MDCQRLAWLTVPFLALSGCDAILHNIVEEDEPPVRNEAAVVDTGRSFGEAVGKKNYAAAYQLLSNPRRAEQSLEQFTAACQQRREEYFEGKSPGKVDTYTYMPFADELPDWTGLPADVKYEALLGVCTVIWGGATAELDPAEADEYLYEVDVVIVDEAGQPKIAHIDWEDEY